MSLILLDIRMPVMDGIETLGRLKSEDITKDIPVILLSNEDLSRDAEKISVNDMGADDYVQKGVTIDDLVERINKVLQAHEDKAKNSE